MGIDRWDDDGGGGERRDGSGRRLEDQLAEHRRDPFAHAPLVDRLTLGAALVRQSVEVRLSALEQFAARVVVLGIVGGIILGAVAGVVAARVMGH